ncbi:CbrC family protein [Streptomyces sp. NPDC007206]|uniref:CbrC family protein n=1 Tax=Streptomyces sp. NPDC007206 TaxID=3154317 RepID=UPI0033F59D18
MLRAQHGLHLHGPPFHTRLCPWCIADGSAAGRFAGEFTNSYGLDSASEDVLYEVTRRSPGFPHSSAS